MNNVFEIETNLDKDSEACCIADKWNFWNIGKQDWENRYQETMQYLYATDTTQIFSQNGATEEYASITHIPKLTQIYDLLCTYYGEALFSLSDYITWEGSSKADLALIKRNKIKDFVKGMLNKGNFRETTLALLQDYVAAGNSFVMPEWHEEYKILPDGTKQLLWEGSVARRIDPLDIVFDPSCKEFAHSPKIIRTVVSLGELKRLADGDEAMSKAFERAMNNRKKILDAKTRGDEIKEDSLNIAGFANYSDYACSDSCELLTFYGDLYDVTTDTFKDHKKITIMDRCIILKEEDMLPINNYNYIFKSGWRDRPNCLWSMSPLENLLGMQYRIDFLENKRADIYDWITNPMIKVRGDVTEPEILCPGAIWHCDRDSDVSYMLPDATILTADTYINMYEAKMESFAGAPKEAMGFRTQGEKTMFEVQQLMNAATRVFNRQIRKFEIEAFEPIVNALYELFLYQKQGHTIRVVTEDPKDNYPTIIEVSVDDLKGEGAIRAVGSEFYADRAQTAQTLLQLGNSGLFMSPDVQANISPAELGKIFLDVTGLSTKYPTIFQKDSRIYEVADQQVKAAQASQLVDEEQAKGLQQTYDNTGIDMMALRGGSSNG